MSIVGAALAGPDQLQTLVGRAVCTLDGAAADDSRHAVDGGGLRLPVAIDIGDGDGKGGIGQRVGAGIDRQIARTRARAEFEHTPNFVEPAEQPIVQRRRIKLEPATFDHGDAHVTQRAQHARIQAGRGAADQRAQRLRRRAQGTIAKEHRIVVHLAVGTHGALLESEVAQGIVGVDEALDRLLGRAQGRLDLDLDHCAGLGLIEVEGHTVDDIGDAIAGPLDRDTVNQQLRSLRRLQIGGAQQRSDPVAARIGELDRLAGVGGGQDEPPVACRRPRARWRRRRSGRSPR